MQQREKSRWGQCPAGVASSRANSDDFHQYKDPGGLPVSKSSSFVASWQHVPQLTAPSSCLTFCTQLPRIHFPPTSAISPLWPPLLDLLLPSFSALGAPGSPGGPAVSCPCSGDSSYPQAFKTISALMTPRCPFGPLFPGPHSHIQPALPAFTQKPRSGLRLSSSHTSHPTVRKSCRLYLQDTSRHFSRLDSTTLGRATIVFGWDSLLPSLCSYRPGYLKT